MAQPQSIPSAEPGFTGFDAPSSRASIAVCAEPAKHLVPSHRRGLKLAAERIAIELGLARVTPRERSHELLLAVTEHRLELRWVSEPDTLPTFVDLLVVDGKSQIGRSKKQPIAKAVGLEKHEREKNAPGYAPLTVLDATAGFGEDSWLLASLGCRVMAVERHPVVAALLADGLRRAALISPGTAARVTLLHGEASAWLTAHDRFEQAPLARPDVVYLDPMFPLKKKSALERKPMRVLRRLVGPDEDAAALLEPALTLAKKRVVVKRAPHSELLAVDGREPVSSHKGKAARYDVYVR